MTAARAKPVKPKVVPDDADVYDQLQEELKSEKGEWGAYSRTARAFGVSAQHVHNVEARYKPLPELQYLPPPGAYPAPVAPLELATTNDEQPTTNDQPATEPATDSQHVMSPPVQLATPESQRYESMSSSSAIAAYKAEYLRVAIIQPRPDYSWMAGPFGLVLCFNMFAVAIKALVRRPDLWWWSLLVIVVYVWWLVLFYRISAEMIRYWRWYVLLLVAGVTLAGAWWWYLYR